MPPGPTTILAPCGDCGQVVVLPRDLTVVRYPDATGWYRFVCPCCGQPTQLAADWRVFLLLARTTTVVLDIVPETGSGAPLALDDLIDLAADLASL
jgi:hypothetical protein